MTVTAEDKARHNKTWKANNPDKAREVHRISQKKWRDKNRERVQERVREWSAKNRDKVNSYRRKAHLKTQYGLTPETRDELLTSQGNRCACCGSDSPNHKQGWVVDHDHVTGKVRGILCQPCNLTLGKVRESTDHLKALIAYLEKHSAED